MSDLIERIEIELERGQTEGWKDPGEAAAAFEPLLREALSELKGMRKAMFDAGMQCGELIVKTGKKLKECQPCVEFYADMTTDESISKLEKWRKKAPRSRSWQLLSSHTDRGIAPWAGKMK